MLGWLVPGAGALAQEAVQYDGVNSLAATSTDLQNTYFGLTMNFYPNSRLATRLQINYVVAGGDQFSDTGLSGYKDDTFLLQIQIQTQK